MTPQVRRAVEKRTIGECIALFIKEKLFSMPALIIAAFTFSVVFGLFSDVVSAEKYKTLCNLYLVIFPTWAASGVFKHVKTNGKSKA